MLQKRLLSEQHEVRDDCAIPGLTYLPEFITADEEGALMEVVNQGIWRHDLKRRVQHYGYRYDYKARSVLEGAYIGELPNWLAQHALKLKKQGWFLQAPDQVIVNEYMPGQGIAPHVDCEPCFGDRIASLSLGSDCVMDFIHVHTGDKQSLVLERRSIVLLTGEARYLWQHGIAARKADRRNGGLYKRSRRISLTFRNVIKQQRPHGLIREV